MQMNSDQLKDMQIITEMYIGDPDIRVSPAVFSGKLVADNVNADKPWAYLTIDKGIPKSAYEALEFMGIPCEPWFDNPHITAVRNDEASELKKVYGDDKWVDAIGMGPNKYLFTIKGLTDVTPVGWDDMDRVWFLEVDCPALSVHRLDMGLTALPTSGDRTLPFHITVAVRQAVATKEEALNNTVLKALLG